MRQPGRLGRAYASIGLFLLNLCLLLVLVNGAVHVAFLVWDHIGSDPSNPVALRHRFDAWEKVYPDLSRDQVDDLLKETWSRPQVYRPFTQFRERPFQGRWVNVHEAGFRISANQGPWPPDPGNFNIFLFGGSTIFSYGVADDETAASYLQGILDEKVPLEIRIYNFGTGNYYSSQERILFEDLLLSFPAPRLAIFVDGLNEFAFRLGPAYTPRLSETFDEANDYMRSRHESRLLEWVETWPLARLARSIRSAMEGPDDDDGHPAPEALVEDDTKVRSVIDRYLDNKALITAAARRWEVEPFFVWQPIPIYRYDLRYHLFAGRGFQKNRLSSAGYRYFARRLEGQAPERDFLWLADMQEELSEPLYVDSVHYTARMNRLLAEEMARALLDRGYLDPGEPPDPP